MNNPEKDEGSSVSSAGTEQDERKVRVRVVRSSDIVRLTNQAAATAPRGKCEALHSNRRNKRLRTDSQALTEVPTAQSFLQRQPNWMLGGYVCIHVEGRTAFHLKVHLSAGKLAESVKLMANLQQYPSWIVRLSDRDPDLEAVDDFIQKIQSFVCTITLLDKNLKNIGDIRCFRFAEPFSRYIGWFFCSQSVLEQACQISPAGANTLKTSGDFEFIDVKIETTIRLKETSQVLKIGSLSYAETYQRKQSSSQDYPSSKTEGIPERPLKFTEIVVLKTGGSSPQKFYVHKDKLIQESPVFARMFDVPMSEKITGEVTLKDCTVPVLEAFICFLYDSVSDSQFEKRVDILLGVFALAHQKGVNRIVERVKEMIISVGNMLLNLGLALRIFTAGDLYEMPDVKFRAVQWIKCNKIQLQTAEGKKQVQSVMDANKDLGSSIVAEILNIFEI